MAVDVCSGIGSASKEIIFCLFRCLVCGMCTGGTAPGAAHLSRGQWGGPAGGNYQGARHTLQRTDQADEPKLQ